MLKESFINRGLNVKFLDTEFQWLSEILKKNITRPQSKEKDQNRIPFVIWYNRANVKQMMNKRWHLLQINSNLRTALDQEPIITYRRSKHLKDLTGSKRILDG